MIRSLVVALIAIACGGKQAAAPRPPAPAPRPEPSDQRPEDPAVTDAVAAAVRSHEVLTSVSAVPASSHVLCNAAMAAAAAAIGQPPEAVAWSGEIERDRKLLGTRLAGVLARTKKALPANLPLLVARAMAMAARNPHVFALDAGGVATLLALVSGQNAPGLGFPAHAAGGAWGVGAVIAGGPAAAAGINSGDRLLSLDRRPFDDQSLIAALLVSSDQRVTIEVEHGEHQPYRKLVELKAEPVPYPAVNSRTLGGGIGLLRIRALPRSKDPAADAAVLVAGALKELDAKKVRRLVIDLRDNPGGAPFDVASILVRGNPLLQIQTPGGPAEPVARTAETWKKRHTVAVLVNGQSYSGAEIVALALQAHGEARIFGEPTGGALTAPGQAQLPGGVTLFFPAQLFLDAKGKAPADQRVTPDERVPSTTSADMAAARDPQLAAAVAWLKKQR